MTMRDDAGIDREAARWVARLDKDQWSDAEEADLQAWLRADVRHRGALLRAEAGWAQIDQYVEPREPAEPRRRRLFARRRVLAGGGAALAASLAGAQFWLGRARTYETDIGEIRRVQLSDGSIAAINTATRIDVQFADDTRQVRVDRGEAWFQVAKNPKRPFIVEIGEVRAVAIGTAFSVIKHSDGAEILVTEGVVEAWGIRNAPQKVRLFAGQRAFVAENSAVALEPGPPAAIDRALAWRSGRIDLQGDTLAAAIAEFNKFNKRKLVLTDPHAALEQFDGSFRIDDIEGFARAVRDSLDIPVDLDDPDEICIGKSR